MVRGEVVGILGCTILQEELLYVLKTDPDLNNVVVIENEQSVKFLPRIRQELPNIKIHVAKMEDLDKVANLDGFSVFLMLKTTSLHRNPDEFRQEVISNCKSMKPYVTSLLLFYGLCRNAMRKMKKVSLEIGMPIMILTDMEGYEVDDCFGAVVGGKRKYLDCIKANHGTMLLITGYADHWANKLGSNDLVKAVEAYENLYFVFDHCGYNRALRMDTGLGDVDRFCKQVDVFARTFDLKLSTQRCDLEVFEHSYALAKGLMHGQIATTEAPVKEELPTVNNETVPF